MKNKKKQEKKYHGKNGKGRIENAERKDNERRKD